MKKKIEARRRRQKYYTSYQFASLLIGFGFGLSMFAFSMWAGIPLGYSLGFGVGVGMFLGAEYRFLMEELFEERRRRSTYKMEVRR